MPFSAEGAKKALIRVKNQRDFEEDVLYAGNTRGLLHRNRK